MSENKRNHKKPTINLIKPLTQNRLLSHLQRRTTDLALLNLSLYVTPKVKLVKVVITFTIVIREVIS